MEIAKTRPIPENTWYQWYDWLISHIPKSMKKSENGTMQKVMRVFESKLDNNTPTDYKPKKTADAHLRDMIDDLKKIFQWEIHQTMKTKFMSSTDRSEKRKMYFWSGSSIIMIDKDTAEIIQELFDLLLRK